MPLPRHLNRDRAQPLTTTAIGQSHDVLISGLAELAVGGTSIKTGSGASSISNKLQRLRC
ncbi:MAG: hypothetical protein H7126_06490 [Candidatus Parcubacteria bacterium]|nr:hypothetical protein [Leptolyngbyaceae cyanobacterium LF-bin-113]